MIQNEHIEEFLRQAHRVGDAGLRCAVVVTFHGV